MCLTLTTLNGSLVRAMQPWEDIFLEQSIFYGSLVGVVKFCDDHMLDVGAVLLGSGAGSYTVL
jgi:hypothetical protein